MPSKIIFVRHGHTPHNSTDHKANRLMGWDHDHVGLSEEGRLDAAVTASKLKNYPIDAAYYSDLKRTTETAEIITNILGIGATPSELIRERNLGSFAEHTMHDLKVNRTQEWEKFLDHHDPDWQIPGGESLRDVHARFAKMLAHLSTNHSNQTVLLITHSGYIHTVLRDHFGFFAKETFVEVDHTSHTILTKTQDSYELTLYNQ